MCHGERTVKEKLTRLLAVWLEKKKTDAPWTPKSFVGKTPQV